MTRQLILVHGRSQQHLDAAALKREWVDTWSAGLAKSGLTIPIAETDIHFPYYGDTLEQMSAGLSAEDAARVVVRGQQLDRNAETFIREWLLEMQLKIDVDDEQIAAVLDSKIREKGPLNWGWVQGILQVLDQKIPGASGFSVALATKDVYDYLTNPSIRRTMNDGVRGAFSANKQAVVVSHSLGTVVAYNVLSSSEEGQELDVPLFVTLGSPLAVKAVKKMVRPIANPKCVRHWFNAMDDRDVVALYPLDADHFEVNPAIENKVDVDNPTSNRHGIGGYLSDSVTSKRIYDALMAEPQHP